MTTIASRLKRFKVNLKLFAHLSLAIIPLIAFTAILLGLVYLKPFDNSQMVGDLSLDTSFTSSTLYVNYPATRLILVASWSSSVALPIIGSLLTFTSYPVAADMIWSSQGGHRVLLPTPSQIAMLTDLLDAKQMAILTWLASFWRKDGRKVPSRWIVEFPAVVQLAGLSLSAAIVAADTWLHVATRSTTKPYLFPISDPESFGMGYYSRTLTAKCIETSSTVCTVEQNATGTSSSSLSDINRLASKDTSYPTRINQTSEGGYFLAPQLPQRVGLIAHNGLLDQTFTAKSFNISTSCGNHFTDLCESTALNSDGTTWTFNCTGGMSGQVNQSQPLQVKSWYQGNGTYNDMSRHYRNSSEVEFGIVMLLMDTYIQSGTDTGTSKGPPSRLNNTLVSARCNSTLNAVQYDWTNETLAATMQNLDDGPDPEDLARLARGPLLAGYFDNNPLLMGAAQENTFMTEFLPPQNSPNVKELGFLRSLEAAISFYGISLLGGAFEDTAAKSLSLPDSVIVTEVGKAPLFTLVILNLWYACFGLLLFGLAMYILRDAHSDKDIREVQELISVHGLATAAVKRHRQNLDSSDLRVGVEKVDGVWQFRVFEVTGVSGESKPLLDEPDEEEGMTQAWST